MALLGQTSGEGKQQTSGGGSPDIMKAVMGVLAWHSIKGQGGDPSATTGGASDTGGISGLLSGGLGGLTGLLSNVTGGDPGSALSGGLQHLMDHFRQNGQGDKVESWISGTPNKPISPPEMEQGLGSEMVGWLVKKTGLDKSTLLSGLCQHLPQAIDRLTPGGRVPTAQEANQQINQRQTH